MWPGERVERREANELDGRGPLRGGRWLQTGISARRAGRVPPGHRLCRRPRVVMDMPHQSRHGSELMATKTVSPLLPTLFISGDRNGSVANQIGMPSMVDTTEISSSQSVTSDVPLIS